MTTGPDPAAPAVSGRVPLHNPANLLTALRLLLVPVFVGFVAASALTEPAWRVAACLVFAVASATDFVDGWIARRFALVTAFGKVADPIADKALTGTALVLLAAYGRLPWWVTAMILARELGVTAIRFWVIRYGVIPASRGGKAKTALQVLAITWYLWPFGPGLAAVGSWIMAVAVLVTVVTGLDYLLRAVRLRRAQRAEAGRAAPGPVDVGRVVPGPVDAARAEGGTADPPAGRRRSGGGDRDHSGPAGPGDRGRAP